MTDFVQLSISGLALGFQYALVALGLVVILKASGILNIFQGGIVLIAGYTCFTAHKTWGLPFVLAAIVTVVLCAAINVIVERTVLKRVTGQSPLIVVFVTFGLLLVAEPIVESIWGSEALDLGDPWGLDIIHLGSVSIASRDVWAIGISSVAVAIVFLIFRFTRLGLGMRANASDTNAAAAQGISPGVITATSWALAGALGAVAGILLCTSVGGGVRPEVAVVAFAALPALYLGGLGSPVGAVVGGLIIGLAQQYAAGYSPAFLGEGFSEVFPYLILVFVLVVRPEGILGQKTVRRA